TVNVGNAGSLQGIVSGLYILNESAIPGETGGGVTTLNVDDSADTVTRGATLKTVEVLPSSIPSGEIDGLAPAAISYAYPGTSVLNMKTGTNFNVVNVQGTGVVTSLTTHANDLFIVGNGGSVQGIQGPLLIS